MLWCGVTLYFVFFCLKKNRRNNICGSSADPLQEDCGSTADAVREDCGSTVDLLQVFQLGHFPASWAQGFITLIHKEGDPDCVNNYRGITPLPVVAKIFSAVMEN